MLTSFFLNLILCFCDDTALVNFYTVSPLLFLFYLGLSTFLLPFHYVKSNLLISGFGFRFAELWTLNRTFVVEWGELFKISFGITCNFIHLYNHMFWMGTPLLASLTWSIFQNQTRSLLDNYSITQEFIKMKAECHLFGIESCRRTNFNNITTQK